MLVLMHACCGIICTYPGLPAKMLSAQRQPTGCLDQRHICTFAGGSATACA